MSKNKFYPDFSESPPLEDSYRRIFKWGDPAFFKHPDQGLYEYIKTVLNLTDDDFKQKTKEGNEKVTLLKKSQLSDKHFAAFKQIVGDENVKTDDWSRVSVAYGKTMYDIMRLRENIAENPPDAVLYPKDKDDVKKIVDYCNKHLIPVVVYGGGSGVTRGVECTKGGITLDFRVHMNKIINIDQVMQTVTVQPGIFGPKLEDELNNATKRRGTKHNYTCGHFPQSFEFSTVGGWVVTRGAGQNSTYYGKIEDIVLSQEYVTPIGKIKTNNIPRQSTGPDVDQIMMGSEGAFGILTEVTLKIFRYLPQNTQRFSFFFKSWESAKAAIREVMQGEFGFPSVFRLSDPEETDAIMKLYKVDGTIIDKVLQILGYKAPNRCMLLGSVDGDKQKVKLIKKKIKRICKQHGSFYTTGIITKKWEHGRFTDAYLREDLGDYGIVLDTLECGVNWSNIENVHSSVNQYIHSRANTICMTHASHHYPQGCNLYFIFVGKFKGIKEYKNFHEGILSAICKSGASLSHHHGIGKLFAPWLEENIGKNQHAIFKSLKKHFDPNNIMNPGGTLALDIDDDKNE